MTCSLVFLTGIGTWARVGLVIGCEGQSGPQMVPDLPEMGM